MYGVQLFDNYRATPKRFHLHHTHRPSGRYYSPRPIIIVHVRLEIYSARRSILLLDVCPRVNYRGDDDDDDDVRSTDGYLFQTPRAGPV